MINYRPNDGPLMRWLLVNGTNIVTEANDLTDRAFALDTFRDCRDMSQLYWEINRSCEIDDLLGSIQTTYSDGYYLTSLILPDVTIEEVTLGAKEGEATGTTIQLYIDAKIPDAMAAALIGQPVGELIDLPPRVRSIVAGHTIESIEPHQQAQALVKLKGPEE